MDAKKLRAKLASFSDDLIKCGYPSAGWYIRSIDIQLVDVQAVLRPTASHLERLKKTRVSALPHQHNEQGRAALNLENIDAFEWTHLVRKSVGLAEMCLFNANLQWTQIALSGIKSGLERVIFISENNSLAREICINRSAIRKALPFQTNSEVARWLSVSLLDAPVISNQGQHIA